MFNSGGGTSSLFAIVVSFLFAVIPSLTRLVRRDYGGQKTGAPAPTQTERRSALKRNRPCPLPCRGRGCLTFSLRAHPGSVAVSSRQVSTSGGLPLCRWAVF